MISAKKTSRRTFFRASARSTLAVTAAGPLLASLLDACTHEGEASPLSSLPPIDNRYGAPTPGDLFRDFFNAKTARDVNRTMSFFSPNLLTYTDATLGWDSAGFDAVRKLFADYMPTWGPSARSYATRLYGQGNRIVVDFTDSPELFGSELRILGIVDLEEGKIMRWVDYWNGRTFPTSLYNQLRTPPVRLRYLPRVNDNAGIETAFSRGDVDALVAALATDAIFEDLTLKLTVIGRIEIGRFLKATIDRLPYGKASQWAYPLPAGGQSGGAEWQASANWPNVQGVMAIGRSPQGAIERMSCIYDGRLCSDDQLTPLLTAAVHPNPA